MQRFIELRTNDSNRLILFVFSCTVPIRYVTGDHVSDIIVLYKWWIEPFCQQNVDMKFLLVGTLWEVWFIFFSKIISIAMLYLYIVPK